MTSRWLVVLVFCTGCSGQEFSSTGTGGAATGGTATGGTAAGGTAAGGTAATDGGGAAGTGATSCGAGTVSGVVDDFEDGVVAPQWTMYGSIFAEEAGKATVKFTPGAPGEAAGLKGAAPLLFTGCSVLAELRKSPNPDAPCGAYFSVSTDDGLSHAEILVSHTDLQARTIVEGQPQSEQTWAYDEKLHAWLRLRDDGGTTHFETSPDGKSWTELFAAKTPDAIQSAHVDFGGTCWGSHPSPGAVEFDNLNRPPG